MTYDVGALHVVALKEIHPDCDIDMSMPDPRYFAHTFVTGSIIDIAEVRPNEHQLGDTVYTDPPDLMALRRVQIQPNGIMLDTGFQGLQEWTGPVYSTAEIEEWEY
ncbi:MAG: hypothetical protein IPL52_07745 [Flavobacteriales bacterium]|nr:hypothetical protein [Flavobacteriales bacterium]